MNLCFNNRCVHTGRGFVALLAVFAACAFGAESARAALLASDSASNAPYGNVFSSLTGSPNGGFGFQPWTFSAPGFGTNAGAFVSDSENNATRVLGFGIDGSPNASNVGKTFGLYAQNGASSLATRPFATVLATGDTFGLDLDNGFVSTAASVGYRLQNVAGTTLFAFQFTGGQANYQVVDAAGTIASNMGYTETGVRTFFTLTTPTTYSFTATRIADGFTFTRTGAIAAGTIDRVQAFNANAGAGAQFDFNVNNLSVNSASVVPESGTLGLIAGALLPMGLIAWRKRRAA